jgi:hypothetical protein
MRESRLRQVELSMRLLEPDTTHAELSIEALVDFAAKIPDDVFLDKGIPSK